MHIKNILPALLLAFFFASAAHGFTLQEVMKRGYLQCGVSIGVPGFSSVDTRGNWSGFDVDFCRAVAVATLGDRSKVKFVPLTSGEAFTALLAGEVDLLSRQAVWTFTRDSAMAVHFTGVSYYDSQGLLVKNSVGAQSIKELKKARICVAAGSEEANVLVDYSEQHLMGFRLVPYESWSSAIKGFDNGCDAISLKKSRLYGVMKEKKIADKATILPGDLAKEPLGPVVRQGDDVWFNIVRWALFAMVGAEELGVTSVNIDEMKISNSLAVKRFFGLEENIGTGVGLKNDWAAEIIRQVGNYGEVFERNFGNGSSLLIDRGLNRLWSEGGLQYAPPLK